MSKQQLLKGAFVRISKTGTATKVLPFQFNPEELTRTFLHNSKTGESNELIRFRLVFNASDGMETEDPDILEQGIYPRLAALEMLLDGQYNPDSGVFSRLRGSNNELNTLVWGSRTIPVFLQQLKIKEKLFNSHLRPVHAIVEVKLRVFSKSQLHGHIAGRRALETYLEQRNRIADTLGFQ